MLLSEELCGFTDDVPVFQMNCQRKILSALLGSKVSTDDLGCLKSPAVLFWFKAD